MVHVHVFLGAPICAEANMNPNGYVWQTLQELSNSPYPPATLDAASRRISLLYQNVLFDSESDHGDDPADPPDQTTSCVTWPSTSAGNTTGAPSFLRPTGSLPQLDTQETNSSIAYSEASSIARFPNFSFSLHKLTPLSSLYLAAESGKGSRKVNVLLAALEVQGPDTVRAKKGPDTGRDISILKLILGDDQSSVCKLTAWRDTADTWGGFRSPGLTRGDIIYFENVVATWEPGTTITLTASPYNKPLAEICYRTMPYTQQDNRFRPDLRLSQSDAAVNKVAAIVRWFENMAGLPGF